MVKAFNKDSKNQTNKSFKSKSIKDRKSADGIKYIKANKVKKDVDDETLQIRRLYNKLMLKKELKKEEIIKKIIDLMKSNYTLYAFKHDGCRVLQGCIKYGSKAQRKLIITSLKDSIYELCIKKYSIYLALKMWKYSDKDQQEVLSDMIIGKLSHIIKNSSGQMFINFVFANTSSSIQQKLVKSYMKKILKVDIEAVKSFAAGDSKIEVDEEVKEEVENIEVDEEEDVEDDENEDEEKPEKEGNILLKRKEGFLTEKFKEEIKKTLELALEKKTFTNSIFHSALSQIFDYLESDVKIYLSELFDDDLDSFLSTKPGVELAIRLYIVSSAKTKKKIIKKIFKDNWTDSLLSNENNLILIIKFLLSTDDTKLSTKQLLKPLVIYSEKTDYHLLAKLVYGILCPGRLNKILDYNLDSSSKKDNIKIKEELLNDISSSIVNMINMNTSSFLIDNDLNGFLIEYVSFLLNINSCEVLLNLNDVIVKFMKFEIENNKSEAISLGNAHFVIVNILKKVILQEKNVAFEQSLTVLFEQYSQLIIDYFNEFITTKGVFIVLTIYESNKFGAKIRDVIKVRRAELERVFNENPKSKGVEILLKKSK